MDAKTVTMKIAPDRTTGPKLEPTTPTAPPTRTSPVGDIRTRRMQPPLAPPDGDTESCRHRYESAIGAATVPKRCQLSSGCATHTLGSRYTPRSAAAST